ncbi:MAG: hypothetical protein VXZ72_00110 [Chlamydiota bacterium]|nr:hypothetical protein [Chlamydiota bacterium]
MDLRLRIKAVQSIQSFSPDIPDEVAIHGEVLGVPVVINSVDAELLLKIDELLYDLNQKAAQEGQSEPTESEYVDYQEAAEYTLGGLVDD